MTIHDLLQLAQQRIDGDSARLDAELLLAFCLQRNRSYLYAWPEKSVDEAPAEKFRELAARRSAGEPIAYLIGKRDLW